MRALLLALLAALAAPAALAQSNDSLVVLWVFEARIMFETVVAPEGPNEVRVVMAVPDGAPVPAAISFAPSGRAARRARIDLAPAGDGTYVGRGEAPAPDRIRAVTVSASAELGAGRFQLSVPAGWEEGVAALRYRAQTADGPSEGVVEAELSRSADPVVLGFNIGMPPTAR